MGGMVIDTGVDAPQNETVFQIEAAGRKVVVLGLQSKAIQALLLCPSHGGIHKGGAHSPAPAGADNDRGGGPPGPPHGHPRSSFLRCGYGPDRPPPPAPEREPCRGNPCSPPAQRGRGDRSSPPRSPTAPPQRSRCGRHSGGPAGPEEERGRSPKRDNGLWRR